MISTSLAATALLMGLTGGPHCVAMCGAACAGIGQAARGSSSVALLTFQLGRVIGYALMGALAAASMQGLGWMSTHSAALRPVWSLIHVAAISLGLVLMWQARQPVWLESAGRSIWQSVRRLTSGWGPGAPLLMGVLWALLPCGLLYSALLVATLTGEVWQGALVMALFALGTSVSMMAAPWLWLRWNAHGDGRWSVRLAGLALAATSAWGLWMGLVHDTAPWCAVPG